MNDTCLACGKKTKLVRHHWYDISDFDDCEITYTHTVNHEPLLLECRGITLYYHERLVCLRCNRLLIYDDMRYSGYSIKPFKTSDDSHILPNWDAQLDYLHRQYRNETELHNNIGRNILKRMVLQNDLQII